MPQVSILLMMENFLYLPVYVADKFELFKKYAQEYEITLEVGEQQTDLDVYRRLKSSRGDDKSIWFGICDPMPIYDEFRNYQDSRGRAIAGLINKATFWAMDRGIEVQDYNELSKNFQKIFTYGRGTTSYAIANIIKKELPQGGSMVIDPIDQKQEWDKLMTSSETGVMAITPDLLNAVQHDESLQSLINIAYSFSSAFSNFLVTALITREDVITFHLGLVKGVLLALEEALAFIHLQDDRVIRLASDLFEKDEKIVGVALDKALKEGIFPIDMCIDRSAWQNAIEIYHEANSYQNPSRAIIDLSYKRCIDQGIIQIVRREKIFPRIISYEEEMKKIEEGIVAKHEEKVKRLEERISLEEERKSRQKKALSYTGTIISSVLLIFTSLFSPMSPTAILFRYLGFLLMLAVPY